MNTDYIYLGSTPSEEVCAAVGITPDCQRINRQECEYYKAALMRKYGQPPEGVSLKNKAEHHDFGTYFEVIAVFDPHNEKAREWAFKCESGLGTWAEVGMKPPFIFSKDFKVAKPNEEITDEDRRSWGLV